MTRRSAEINNRHSTYIFCGIIPLCNFQYRNRVHSITLIRFEIISQNLVEIYSMTRRGAEINNRHSTYIFCGIIPLCNFQYRNRVRSITLISFEIISRNLVQYKAWPAILQRLKLVTPLTLFAELFPFLISRIDIVSAL